MLNRFYRLKTASIFAIASHVGSSRPSRSPVVERSKESSGTRAGHRSRHQGRIPTIKGEALHLIEAALRRGTAAPALRRVLRAWNDQQNKEETTEEEDEKEAEEDEEEEEEEEDK